jgi:glutathione S-transferase
MTLEVIWGSGSPYAWRVLLTLEAKALGYESRLVSQNEHRKPEYLALNPRGKVPILRDGDFVLTESLAIMAYLDRKHPEPRLFGSDVEATGLIWKAISEFESYVFPLAIRIARPVFRGMPLDEADIGAAAADLHGELARMDKAAAAESWLAAGEFSAADIAVYPFIEMLLRTAGKDSVQALGLGLLPLAEHYPALADWRRRIEALPGYARTYPPHWRAAA